MNWERIWQDARAVRTRIEEWITFKGLPDPVVYIEEDPDTHQEPRAFTFIARVGLLQESQVIGADIINNNAGDIGLLGQAVAHILYAQLTKN